MKRYCVAILAVMLSLPGCIKPDMSDCGVEDNCVLLFQIDAGAAGGVMIDKLSSVDTFLFDSDGRYVAQGRVENSDLVKFPGIKLTASPGNYYVVCWGNISGSTTFIGVEGTLFEDCLLSTTSHETGGQLYYAPSPTLARVVAGGFTRAGEEMEAYRVVIPANGVVEKEMAFTRGHRTINVYIDNYYAESQAPQVELAGMPSKVDFFLNVTSDRKSYKQSAQNYTSPEGEMYRSVFHAPIADIDEDMKLNIYKSSDGTPAMEPLSIKEYVEQNSDIIDDLNEIDLLVRFNPDATVTITLPSWSNISVDPLGK